MARRIFFLGNLATVPAHVGEDDISVIEVPTGRNTGGDVPTEMRRRRFLVNKRTMVLSELVKWFMKTLTGKTNICNLVRPLPSEFLRVGFMTKIF